MSGPYQKLGSSFKDGNIPKGRGEITTPPAMALSSSRGLFVFNIPFPWAF
jgi:hypothetical protein